MEYSRRHFIGTAAAGVGAMLLNIRFAGAAPVGAGNHDPYETVQLGKTGIKTTRLCMGTGISGGGRQSNLTRLGYEQAVKLVREIYNRGVRMFDLADTYGTHAIVSDALKIYPRRDYVLFTKLWFMKGAIPEAERPDAETVIARFLTELQTDYIDGVQLHCVTSGNWNTELSDHMTSLDKLKQKGMIRSHGLSCHALAAVETAVREPWVDTIHVRFNAYGAKMDDKVEKMEPVVKQLHQGSKGVIAMKIIGEGEFSKSDEQRDNSFRYVLQSGAVDVLNIGMDKTGDIIDTESRIRKVSVKKV
ncbi:MAG: aldo/keto reductase [Bacteroidales bacterium]|jgi:aryl-alcohol dehydrogenase-like predicted oxidoreductase|nr:aldo/keto reductase [Bacteroidales bacterium]